MIAICDSWLHKFYSFYMEAVICIISKHGYRVDADYKNQPNKSKLGYTVWAITLTVSVTKTVVHK